MDRLVVSSSGAALTCDHKARPYAVLAAQSALGLGEFPFS